MKYVDQNVISSIITETKKILQIRNDIMDKYHFDILDNDNISSLVFLPIIQKIDSHFMINFSRNGEDGQTILDGNPVNVELKTTKVRRLKKGGYSKATFAFHAKGILNHDIYIFNIWDKSTLTPVKFYYVKSKESIKCIHEILYNLSEEWSKKPTTKAGFDIIHIKEEILINMVKEVNHIDDCLGYIL